MKSNLQLLIRSFLLAAVFSLSSFNAICQNVFIPDANFKAALVANTSINTNGDTEIQITEAAAFSGPINVINLSISDLTGIGAFTALTFLNCYNNQLTSLNVSANTALTHLWCYNNQLTSLNVSANTALTYLLCYSNQLTTLNVSANTSLLWLSCNNNQLTSLNVSANTALTQLWCSNNQLTTLNVSANTALTSLWCSNNPLTGLNVSANTALTYLGCSCNSLTSLNVSANTALTQLDCYSNQLTSLDVTTNSALQNLYCYSNQLTTLNVSANSSLLWLSCSNNQLTSLNVQNGNNVNFFSFFANNNSNLTCIQVDDVAWSTANWTAPSEIDATASFSLNCSVGLEEENNQAFTLFPNPISTQLNLSTEKTNQSNYIISDVSGRILRTGNFVQNTTINVNDFSRGTYFIRLLSAEGISNKKFIKQ